MSSPHQRTLLRSALEGLHRDLTSVETDLVATRAIRANGGDDDEHDPDGIPLSTALQLLEGRRTRTITDIRDAEHALVDLQQGTYGTCKVCRRPIPPGRLAVRPCTSTCVDCAA